MRTGCHRLTVSKPCNEMWLSGEGFQPLVTCSIFSNSLSKQSTDIISSEAKLKLDMLRLKFLELAIKYKKSFNAAYAKLVFYD